LQKSRKAASSQFCYTGGSNQGGSFVMALVEERWHAEVYFAQVKAGLNPVSPVLPDSDLLPGV
jgi:hypothetical protein